MSDSDESEDVLIARARAGDANALAMLYRRYAPSLMATAYQLLASREDAEDVLHDVFVGLPEALRKYAERGAFRAWLHKVTVRVALSALRRDRGGNANDPDVLARVPVRSATIEDRISLQDAVASLPSSLRAVLVLKEIEGFTHAEVAAMLGITRGASEVRLHRALAALRASLTQGEDR